MLSTLYFVANTIWMMSIKGSVLVLGILGFRMLFSKVSGRIGECLWLVASYVFLCPMTLFSLQREVETESIGIMIQGVRKAVIGENWKGIGLPVCVWIVGAVVILGITLYQYIKMYKILRSYRKSTKSNVVEVPVVQVPFVWGIIRPFIVIPDSLNEEQRRNVLFHEENHIRYGDSVVKLLFFTVVVIHWFNPCVWILWHCADRDLEMACDQAVTRNMTREEKKQYITSLLQLSCREEKETLLTSHFSQRRFLMKRIRNLTDNKSIGKGTMGAAIVLLIAGVMLALFQWPGFQSDYRLITDILQEPELAQVFLVSDPAVAVNALYEESSALQELASRPSAEASIDAYIVQKGWGDGEITGQQEISRDQLLYVKDWLIKKR